MGEMHNHNIDVLHKLTMHYGAADCWEWQGTKRLGYGRVHYMGSRKTAHRVVYEMLIGPVPDGMELDHLCRNESCVNPSHLEPVTPRENQKRGVGHGGKIVCIRGHEFSIRPSGRRVCKTCKNAFERARTAKWGRRGQRRPK